MLKQRLRTFLVSLCKSEREDGEKTTLVSGEAKLVKREARVGGSKVALCRWTVLTEVRPVSDLVDKPERS